MSDQGIFPLRAEHKRESGVFLLLLPFVSAMIYIYTCVCTDTTETRAAISWKKKKREKRAVQEFIITWWRVSKRQESQRGARGTGADGGAAMKSRLGLAVWHAHHLMRTSRKSHSRLFRISPPSQSRKTVGNQKTFSLFRLRTWIN